MLRLLPLKQIWTVGHIVMNIAHIVTLVSRNGAFGGPLAVARAQTAELRKRGHEVSLIAGWDGDADIDPHGVQLWLFRARTVVPGAKFFGLFSGRLLARVLEERHRLDVVHVHLGRDLISLTSAVVCRAVGLPFVVQTHGMVMPNSRAAVKAIDLLFTRSILRSAEAVYFLTDAEEQGLRLVSRDRARLVRLRNGAAEPLRRRALLPNPPADCRQVVFCARLHPRKGVLRFAEMARLLIDWGYDFRFVVAGPDEGDLAQLLQFIDTSGISGRLTYVGALAPDHVESFLTSASVLVLPSTEEPFPMTVLEALRLGVPCVITDSCGIAQDIDGQGASVAGAVPAELAAAVVRLTYNDDDFQTARLDARNCFLRRFSVSGVADALEDRYRQIVVRS